MIMIHLYQREIEKETKNIHYEYQTGIYMRGSSMEIPNQCGPLLNNVGVGVDNQICGTL